MQKLLIALVTTLSTQKKNFLRQLVNQLNIAHISIDAPLLAAMELATGIDKAELMFAERNFTKLPKVLCTADELKNRLRMAYALTSPNYLLNELAESLTSHTTAIEYKAFDGFAVSDITQTNQAEFIRDAGGLVIHLVSNKNNLPHPIKPEPSDFVLTVNGDGNFLPSDLTHVCKNILARFSKPINEAA